MRVYHFAGTQHIMGATMPPGVCALPPNTVDPRPFLRAQFVAMDRWVRDETAPPPFAHPRLADRTLVPMRTWRFPGIPGVQKPAGPAPKRRFDYGPEFARGVFGKALPGVLEGDYPVLALQVDGDGNEIAGLRVPEQAVPIATSMGWVVRGAASGTPGELCDLDDSIVPFVRRADQRRDFRDPRPSLAERYGTPDAYEAKVSAAAAALAQSGNLLEEDLSRLAARAAAVRW